LGLFLRPAELDLLPWAEEPAKAALRLLHVRVDLLLVVSEHQAASWLVGVFSVPPAGSRVNSR
jgi:hypothetical protein